MSSTSVSLTDTQYPTIQRLQLPDGQVAFAIWFPGLSIILPAFDDEVREYMRALALALTLAAEVRA